MQEKNRYFELFAADAKEQFSAEAEALTTLKQQCCELRESLKLEQAAVEKLEADIITLKESAGMSISSGQDCADFKASRTAFKDDLIRLKNDLDNSRELIKTLTACIPKKQTERERAAHSLQIRINNFTREKTSVADDKIRALVIDIISERKSFIDGFHKIYADFEIAFVIHDENLFPGRLNRKIIDDLKRRLQIVDAPASSGDRPSSLTPSVVSGPTDTVSDSENKTTQIEAQGVSRQSNTVLTGNIN